MWVFDFVQMKSSDNWSWDGTAGGTEHPTHSQAKSGCQVHAIAQHHIPRPAQPSHTNPLWLGYHNTQAIGPVIGLRPSTTPT